jgi:hypothetical protein
MTPCRHVTLPELDKVFQLITSIQVFQTGFYTHFSAVLSVLHPLPDSSYSTWSVTGMENAMINFSCMLCWNEWCLGSRLHRCSADGRLTSLVKFGRPVNVMSCQEYHEHLCPVMCSILLTVYSVLLRMWPLESCLSECKRHLSQSIRVRLCYSSFNAGSARF